MADMSKLKRRNSLGVPPTMNEASQNLRAPEVAPAAPMEPLQAEREREVGRGSHAAMRPERIDGRTLHRTGRILGFSTRVSYEFDETLRRAAQRDGILLIEVLERALAMYELAPREQRLKN